VSTPLILSASAGCPFFFNHSCWCLQLFFSMTFPVIKVTHLWRAWTFLSFSSSFSSRDHQTHYSCSSWFGLFLIQLDKRVDMTSSKMRVSLPWSMVVTIWSYDCRRELRSINALFSSSILTSTVKSSLITLLKQFRCSNIDVPSFMCSPYNFFLRYILLERLLVIYIVSNFDHNRVDFLHLLRCA